MAKYNPSAGAFINGDNMVAWIFRCRAFLFHKMLILYNWSYRFYRNINGLLGALQTDEQHCGKGYATIVLKAISRQIAQLGHDIYAGIFAKNTPSRGLFEKLGFELVGEVHFISTPISWTEADDE